MNDNQLSKLTGKNRSTIGRWRKQGILQQEIAKLDVACNTNDVADTYVAQDVATDVAPKKVKSKMNVHAVNCPCYICKG